MRNAQKVAIDLVYIFLDLDGESVITNRAKQCATITAQTVINEITFFADTENGEEFWKEVKQEIENL